eukprot:CAMPEP_0117688736 /NCGR_PEP_ID=MMETSP0804-20121206/24029_1 /TAXON_ID=1074897 /ORGANISM="Tetraselmis astigmatica, Strain CCMP880" /LENGTH=54 /DNA_ID=CAMNT_0005501289 /DNA_START=334 /DNA_END=498 /DNA_ORIENTATION=-
MPAWFFLRGNQLSGRHVGWVDKLLCYGLMYVLGPAVSVLGLLWVAVDAANEYSS